ncbi:MAG: type II secretion system protein [Candidatus Uhrbacteria bacterium]|nr:type II secretion system protein [Candidatus Uhrbacteria bacterium]
MDKRGFTLIELMVVIAILVVMTLMAGIFTSVSSGRNELLAVTTDAVDTLRRAQWHTMLGNEDSVWGVHFETQKFVLFKGGTYSAVDPSNIETDIAGVLSISSMSLNGGGSEVIFTEPMGETLTDGTVTFENSNTGESATVTVNEVGMIDF